MKVSVITLNYCMYAVCYYSESAGHGSPPWHVFFQPAFQSLLRQISYQAKNIFILSTRAESEIEAYRIILPELTLPSKCFNRRDGKTNVEVLKHTLLGHGVAY